MYASGLEKANSTLQSDLKALNAEDARLRNGASSSWLLPQRQQLARDQSRTEAVISAFNSASSLFKIEQGQLTAFQSLVDVVEQFDNISGFIDRQDAAGALAGYPPLEQKLQALVSAASAPNVPPQFTAGVNLLKSLGDDLKRLLQAIQANDAATEQTLALKIEAEANALGSFDSSGMDTYEEALLKPYRDAYESGMKKAGFTLSG